MEANELYDKDLEVCTIQATTQTIRQLLHETQSDIELIELAKTLIDGWPETISKIKSKLKKYFIHRYEISQENGITVQRNTYYCSQEYAI